MKKVQGVARYILFAVGFLMILFLVWYFSSIVTYILVSAVLSLVGRPIVHFLKNLKVGRFAISETIAAFLTLVVMWIVFVGAFRFLIPLLAKEFEQLSTINLDSVLAIVEKPLKKWQDLIGGSSDLGNKGHMMELIRGQFGDSISFSSLTDVFGTVVGTLGELFIAFFAISFITFFFLKEESMLREWILLIVPSEYEERATHILHSVYNLLRRYFIGLIFEVTMVGVLVTLGLTIVGIGLAMR